VEARNSVGYSDYSEVIELLVAQVPDQVLTPSTRVDGDYVTIEWDIPYDGSSPLLWYTIVIQ
jgi:hypothetical protein